MAVKMSPGCIKVSPGGACVVLNFSDSERRHPVRQEKKTRDQSTEILKYLSRKHSPAENWGGGWGWNYWAPGVMPDTWAGPFEGLAVGQQVLVEVQTDVGLQTVREALQNLKESDTVLCIGLTTCQELQKKSKRTKGDQKKPDILRISAPSATYRKLSTDVIR